MVTSSLEDESIFLALTKLSNLGLYPGHYEFCFRDSGSCDGHQLMLVFVLWQTVNLVSLPALSCLHWWWPRSQLDSFQCGPTRVVERSDSLEAQ